METGHWIALGSALFALGAAFYARRAVKEAGRQNEIGIHKEKKGIFEEFSNFRIRLKGLGPDNIKDEHYLNLYDLVEESKFYYPETVYNDLNMFRQRVSEMLDIGRVIQLHQGEKRNEYLRQQTKKLDECRGLADSVTESMKTDLGRIRTPKAECSTEVEHRWCLRGED